MKNKLLSGTPPLLLILAALPLAAQTPPNWTFRNTRSSPSPRNDYAMVYDAAHHQVVLFGGGTGAAYYNDTWIWNGSNWTQVSPQTSPSARIAYAMAYDAARSQVVLFGGSNNDGALNDTWVWDGTNWTQKSSPFSAPSIRQHAAMAYDSAHSDCTVRRHSDQIQLHAQRHLGLGWICLEPEIARNESRAS